MEGTGNALSGDLGHFKGPVQCTSCVGLNILGSYFKMSVVQGV